MISEGGGLTWNLTWNLRSGASSLASTLEYRVSDFLHGTEFATHDKSGLVSFAVGNDVQPSADSGKFIPGHAATVAASRMGWYQRRPWPTNPKNPQD